MLDHDNEANIEKENQKQNSICIIIKKRLVAIPSY